MSFFTFDEAKASEGFGLVAEGTYEGTIIAAEETKTKANDPMLTLTYEVRSDFTQEHQGAKFMYNNFTFGSDGAKGVVQGLLKSAGFANGHNFKDLADMANQLIGRNLQLVVKHEPDYNDPKITRAKVKYTQPTTLAQPQNGPIEVSEDNLPF